MLQPTDRKNDLWGASADNGNLLRKKTTRVQDDMNDATSTFYIATAIIEW